MAQERSRWKTESLPIYYNDLFILACAYIPHLIGTLCLSLRTYGFRRGLLRYFVNNDNDMPLTPSVLFFCPNLYRSQSGQESDSLLDCDQAKIA